MIIVYDEAGNILYARSGNIAPPVRAGLHVKATANDRVGAMTDCWIDPRTDTIEPLPQEVKSQRDHIREAGIARIRKISGTSEQDKITNIEKRLHVLEDAIRARGGSPV